MKKTLFDLSVCQPNKDSKFHGGGVYGYIVFKELVKIEPKQIVAYYYFNRFIEPSVLMIIERLGIQVVDRNKVSIGEALRQSGAERVYSPLYSSHYDKIIAEGMPFIITVHGLRALEMLTDRDEPNYATDFKQWLKAKIKISLLGCRVWKKYYRQYETLFSSPNVRIVTVSQHSKYSIKSYYPQVNIDNISVFYSPSTTVNGYEQYSHQSKEKYYMIISANRWLKNAGRAIAALDRIFDNHPNICDHVKVLGLKKTTGVYKRIQHKEKFELLGYQTQEQLESIYAGAYAFIYPTLNEGFGYPPLEAMKYGVPVVASAFSSIPEVCGDAVLYANPYSVEEISNRILQLENQSLYAFMKKRGLERYSEIYDVQMKDLDDLIRCIISEDIK